MQSDDSRNCAVFLHIEKAAGSTMHDIMYSNFFPYYVASPARYRKGVDNHRMHVAPAQLAALMRPGVRAAGGHPLRCFGDYAAHGLNPLFFTFLRDPVARYLSHYFYQREVMGIGWSFEDFLVDPYFSNFMCKKIAGVGDGRAAIALAEERQVFLGRVEEFDRDLAVLGRRMHDAGLVAEFDCSYVVRNSSAERRSGGSNEKKLLLDRYGDRIAANNAEDMVLYEHAVDTRIDAEAPTISFSRESRALKPALKIVAGKVLRRWWFMPREKRVGYLAG